MDKFTLRAHIKQLKAQVTPGKRKMEARYVFTTIQSLRCFREAQSVLFYASLPDELPTNEFLDSWAISKQVLLPRVNGDDLDILPYDAKQVATGAFGITEPAGTDVVDPASIQLIIVPAIALDGHCNRLGRGRGYYDRLLSRCPQAYTIGVALDCQFVDEVPVDPHDQPLCGVITASHVCFRRAFKGY